LAPLEQEKTIVPRPARPEEYPAVGNLVDRAFRPLYGDSYEGVTTERRLVEILSQEDPSFRPQHLRLVEAGGQIVSMMMLIERQLRFGSASVRGNIIAPVATDPDHERQGHCSRVMRDAVAYMKRAGFAASLLWGVPWLYPHYGYSSALPWVRVSLTLQHISPPDPRGDYRFGLLSAEHIPSVNALYADNQAYTIGSEVRSDDWWEWRPRHPQALYEVALDETGAVTGYLQAIAHPDGLMVFDVGIRDRAAGEAVLSRLLGMAVERKLERFDLDLSPEHPFARLCFAYNGELRMSRGGGAGMIRVLDLPTLLGALEPVFTQRVAHSERGTTGNGGASYVLRLTSDEGAATLHVADGRVRVGDERAEADDEAYVPLAVFNPLVTGFQPRAELLAQPGVVLSSERAARMLEVLFPPGYPHWTAAATYQE
jgi:predicted N-acetyltransferase YhbS